MMVRLSAQVSACVTGIASGASAKIDFRRSSNSRFASPCLAGLCVAFMLRFAVIDQTLGRRLLCGVDQIAPYTMLRSQLGDRPYLCDMLQRYTDKHTVPFARIVEIVSMAPPQ